MQWATGLAIGETIWVVGLCIWIIQDRRSPVATLAWIFALAWLPVAGIAIYLLIGPRRLTRKRLHYHRGTKRLAEALRHVRTGGRSADIVQAEHWRPLMELGRRSGYTLPARAHAIELFTGGDACFAAMEAAIAAAQHHVHLETYIWARDIVGRRFGALLAAKARDGVEVRVLIDAIGSARLGRGFLQTLRAAGAEVASFNPMSLARFRPDLVNFRTHRKILVCDGRTGFVGGTNIWDVHSAAVSGSAAWRDTHARIDGPPVSDLQLAFLENWQFANGSAPTSAIYFPERGGEASGPWMQILTSGPNSDHHTIEKFCFAAIAGARRQVMITTPYFVPNEPMLSALMTAALRGVTVRIAVPSRNDHWLVAAASRSYYEGLIRGGVQILEYGPNMLHAKVLIVDDDIALVGTANMDNRSFRLNFEIAAAIYDCAVVEQLTGFFEHDLQSTVKVRLRKAHLMNWLQRLLESTARLFSPML